MTAADIIALVIIFFTEKGRLLYGMLGLLQQMRKEK